MRDETQGMRKGKGQHINVMASASAPFACGGVFDEAAVKRAPLAQVKDAGSIDRYHRNDQVGEKQQEHHQAFQQSRAAAQANRQKQGANSMAACISMAE